MYTLYISDIRIITIMIIIMRTLTVITHDIVYIVYTCIGIALFQAVLGEDKKPGIALHDIVQDL